jgi:LPS-assembly protein
MPSTRARAVWGPLLLVLPLVLGSPGAGLAQSPRAPVTIQQEGAGQVSVIADQIQQVTGPPDLLIAVGNVEIVRGASRLLADRVELNRDTGEAVAQGKVVFYDGEDRLVGDRVDYNLKTGTGVVYNANAFSAPYYSLSGRRLDRIGEGVYEGQDTVFTTCEGDNPDWSIRLRSCFADLNDIVSGWHASFWVRDIPLIPWFPWFAAAIRRERQSGFLFPQAGVSSSKGVFARVPYYWAIDDSQDLTVSLDTFTSRGVGASLEYRYIRSQDAAGSLSGFVLQEVFKDNDTRGVGTLKHTWQVTPGLSFTVDANATTDDRVFREYGDRLNDRSKQRAETNVFVTRRWDKWNLVGNVLWYQDLTTSQSVELQRVPEIRLDGLRQPIPGLPGFLYETQASFTNFIRDVGANGMRTDLHPRVFYPIPVGSYFTVTPFAGGRATHYDKRVVGKRVIGAFEVEETVDDSHIRSQVEGGVELETRLTRVWAVDGTWGLSALQHVIEPRATWTEIRGVNQKDNPQFDLAIDDIGKVSQVTYSITQRLNAKTVAGPNQAPVRWEAARLVLSQTYNLLPAADQPFKDFRAELILKPNEMFGFRGDAAWNFYGLGLRTATADVTGTYKDVDAALGVRHNDISLVPLLGTRLDDELDTRFLTANAEIAARITAHVNARASTHWDVKRGTKVENRFGVDIHFQCWAILLEYVDRHNNEDEFRFSINLLGLGQTGTRFGTGIR